MSGVATGIAVVMVGAGWWTDEADGSINLLAPVAGTDAS